MPLSLLKITYHICPLDGAVQHLGVENLAESITQCPSPLARIARISYNSSSNTVSSHDGDNLNDITYLGKHYGVDKIIVLTLTNFF